MSRNTIIIINNTGGAEAAVTNVTGVAVSSSTTVASLFTIVL